MKVTDEHRRILQAHFAERAEAWADDYDGARGNPPAWVPEQDRLRFYKIREQAVAAWGYTPDTLAGAVASYPPSGASVCRCHPNGKPWDWAGLSETIGFLAHLRSCVALGEAEGLRLLAGDDAVKGIEAKRDRTLGAKVANEIWESNPERRIGEVAGALELELIAGRFKAPEKPERIAKWLRETAKNDGLTIPTQAQSPGRPRKSNK